MKIIERKVQSIGQSCLVSLPKPWTKTMGIRKGSMLKLVLSEQGNLSIVPEFTKPAEPLKETTLVFDQHFRIRLFREYFQGKEQITFIFKKKISAAESEEFYSFLRRFMNVQIIEESEGKVVLKCFKIEELSIEECLKRMHFLSLNLMEESAEKGQRSETLETITRFYYMLVMQVRRFLAEGKFAQENQITLIRGMDFRMVAEKIMRIAELSSMMSWSGKDLPVKEFYRRSYLYFLNNEWEKASQLYAQIKRYEEQLQGLKQKEKQRKEIATFEKSMNLLQLIRHIKSMAMLTK